MTSAVTTYRPTRLTCSAMHSIVLQCFCCVLEVRSVHVLTLVCGRCLRHACFNRMCRTMAKKGDVANKLSTPSAVATQARPTGRKRKADSEASDDASIPVPAPRATRLRQGGDSVEQEATRVLFTGIIDKDAEDKIRLLNGSVVDTVEECTHLYAEKIKRSIKFLCAVAQGKHVVGPKWLQQSVQAGAFSCPETFALQHREGEKDFSMGLKQSLQRARERPLFEGKSFFVTKGCRPPPRDMGSIIRAAGGTVVATLRKSKRTGDNGSGLLIVSTPNDAAATRAMASDADTLYSTELVLAGVLRQDRDFKKYALK
eukprot:m.604260 g.604260  ORF g.604260 m.604260 type:complete len:314 (+) comp22458_c0_seq2:247-1188(+)